jgi:hypothetical protein
LAQPGPYDKIWKSDNLIPAALKSGLVQALAPLESLPDSEKDWHPGSDGQVLDLVHPSLYPVVYNQSVLTSGTTIGEPSIDSPFISERFQWMPSDFEIGADGSARLSSPYINNVHSDDHAELVNMIPQLLTKAIPMFERVLSDLAREKALPTRLDLGDHLFPDCIWPGDEVSYCLSALPPFVH